MAYPTRYQRGYSFSGYQTTNPSKPLPGPALDNELENVEQSIGATITSLGLIQRSDGALRNGIVGNDQLAPGLQTGVNPATEWATGISYAVGDTVFADVAFYRCIVGHVSTVFAADLAAAKWLRIADFEPIVADAIAAREDAEAAAVVATGAATTATTAAGSASASAGTATAAAATATTAANSAVAAFDNFDDRYLGAKATPPALDNDGNALLIGALYFDTVLLALQVWNGAAWTGVISASFASQTQARVGTATNVATSPLSVADHIGFNLGVTRSQIATRYIPVNAFLVTGESAHGDLGAGALYVRGTSGGLRAAQDAAGTWWNLSLPNGVVNAGWFGLVGNNIANDAPAMLAAFTAWKNLAGAVSRAKLVVPAGQYRLNSAIDLTAIFSATDYYGLELDCDAGAWFYCGGTQGTVLFFGPPNGGKFVGGRFRFPNIQGSSKNTVGLRLRAVSNSFIEVPGVGGCDDGAGNGAGIHFDTASATEGVYNNVVDIASCVANNIGILSTDSGVPPHGLQGNLLRIGHLSFCRKAMWLLNQSTSNTFHIGALEGNVQHGVLDQAGYNIYRVNFSTDTVGDQIEIGTANGRIDIEGWGLYINNSGGAKGWVKDNKQPVAPVNPTMPASGTPFVNTYRRPATMTINSTGISNLVIDGTPIAIVGSFSIPYGASVVVTYSPAPTWIWTFH